MPQMVDDKNEPSRFLGEGVSFKAKLIGILEVSEARGDRMCQEALADLKMAIRAAGEHKQRITIHVAIDGLRLRDEKTGDSLYHHPVHKISFIAQDMSDSRAFGYIFGSPDTGHRFFGIKTDKAASQVVIAMRDLFQVVFELKKKEIELAKQHLEQKSYVSNSKIGYKPFLPPPPSGKERSNRTTSESGGVFSPRPGLLSASSDSRQDSSMFDSPTDNSDWFSASSFANEEHTPGSAPAKSTTNAEQAAKHEEKKNQILAQFDVFTELDPLGTGKIKPYVDKKLFFQELKNPPKKVLKDLVSITPTGDSLKNDTKTETFQKDPFADEDPFDKVDPFAEEHFQPQPQDPFNTDFIVDFKMYNKQELKPIPSSSVDSNKDLIDQLKFPPVENILDDNSELLQSTKSPSKSFTKTFDYKFDFHDKRKEMALLHENPSLDLSSESESTAPEPPPRPSSNITPTIKPPPLPPKKQQNDMTMKPPPRPPHTDTDFHYDYIQNDERTNSLDSLDKSPPLPVPARKAQQRTDWDLSAAPQRPKKSVMSTLSDEYLTPVPPSVLPPQKKSPVTKTPILLPPPQKKDILKRKSPPPEKTDADISELTLTDLTTCGLDKLAAKLNVPASKLSNMTLVELTSFLQEHLLAAKKVTDDVKDDNTSLATFKAEFSMNFSDFNDSSKLTNENTYDRYAVFRELIEKEEISDKTECSESQFESITDDIPSVSLKDEIPVKEVTPTPADRYAALREIIVEDLEATVDLDNTETLQDDEISDKRSENELNPDSKDFTKENDEDLFHSIDNSIFSIEKSSKDPSIYELTKPLEEINETPTKDVEKSISKSPGPMNQPANHLTSGSLSDVVTNSSPEVDKNSPDVKKKETTTESWAIFDTPKLQQKIKEKPHHEDGISPWSSDSKEFVNTSPIIDWQQRKDSGGSGSEQWTKYPRSKDSDGRGWWDSREKYDRDERERHRRSTDSYDDEYEVERNYHGETRRMKQTTSWSRGHQSSSSRDVSPWEEEPCRDWSRRRGPARRNRDSWDEDDDYDYDIEHPDSRWSNRRSNSRERHMRRPPDDDMWNIDDRRHGPRRRHRDADHHCCGDWEQDSDTGFIEEERYPSRYSQEMWRERDRKRDDERYYSRTRPQEHWEQNYPPETEEHENHSGRYLSAKRNWKRPSSASEMDRKSGENKSRSNQYHMAMTGSDGERERRYKTTGRRARSRDSEIVYNRHKPDPGLTLRHKSRERHPKSPFEDDFSEHSLDTPSPKTKYDFNVPKTGKKILPSPKSDIDSSQLSTSMRPRHVQEDIESPTSSKINKFKFDSDFISDTKTKFDSSGFGDKKSQFDSNYFNQKESESFFENDFQPEKEFSSNKNFRDDSQFEDNFLPASAGTGGISSISEEGGDTQESFTRTNSDKNVNFNDGRRHKNSISKRLSSSLRSDNLKKSESVNIFARESDPFDDEFFNKPENGAVVIREHNSKQISSETVQWSEDFDNFEVTNKNV